MALADRSPASRNLPDYVKTPALQHGFSPYQDNGG